MSNKVLNLLNKEFVTLEELTEIDESNEVEKVEFNGVSGKDGSSNWYSVYIVDGEEYQIYVREI